MIIYTTFAKEYMENAETWLTKGMKYTIKNSIRKKTENGEGKRTH